MMRDQTRFLTSLLLGGVLSLTLSACPKHGAQRAGEKLDDAKDKVSDTLDPKGPAEKAGRKIDRALGE